METSIGIFNGHETFQLTREGKIWRRSTRFPDVIVSEDGSFYDLRRSKSLSYETRNRKGGKGRTGCCRTRSSAIGGVDEITVAFLYCTSWIEKPEGRESRIVAKDGDSLNFSPGNLSWVNSGRKPGVSPTPKVEEYVALSSWKQQELKEQNQARRDLGLPELTVSTYTCDACLKTYEYVAKKNVCGCYSSHLEGNFIYCDWGKRIDAKVKVERKDAEVVQKSGSKAWGDNWYALKRSKGRPKGSKNLPKGHGSYEESSMEAP